MTEEVSTAPTDASVAGSSVAITEAEEDAASYAAAPGKEFTLPINFKGDVSIAPTDASVAGSSVAATEADEDALYADPNATINEVLLTNVTVQEGDDEDVAPMHLHVLRTPAKLKGTGATPGGRSRSSSRSRPGSRRNSNSPCRVNSPGGSLKPTLGDAASLASSMEEDVDPDILLDRFGFQDLDPKLTQEDFQDLLKKHLSGQNSLPTLNERMSEETLEDVHAFHDLVFVKKKNKGSSGTGSPSSGSMAQSSESEEAGSDDAHCASLTNFSGLEALNEEEEEDEDEHAAHDTSNVENDSNDADQSPASSISGDDINLTESDLHPEDGGDVVVELPDPSLIQKEHDNAAATQDPSVMAVEDKSDNEELNLADEEAVVLPTEVMEELRISDECRLKGEKSREFDTTEGDTEGR